MKYFFTFVFPSEAAINDVCTNGEGVNKKQIKPDTGEEGEQAILDVLFLCSSSFEVSERWQANVDRHPQIGGVYSFFFFFLTHVSRIN